MIPLETSCLVTFREKINALDKFFWAQFFFVFNIRTDAGTIFSFLMFLLDFLESLRYILQSKYKRICNAKSSQSRLKLMAEFFFKKDLRKNEI